MHPIKQSIALRLSGMLMRQRRTGRGGRRRPRCEAPVIRRQLREGRVGEEPRMGRGGVLGPVIEIVEVALLGCVLLLLLPERVVVGSGGGRRVIMMVWKEEAAGRG